MTQPVYSDSFVPNETAITHWIVAGLAVIGTGFVGWHLGWPWVLDIEHPDFNPAILLVLLLAGVAVWSAVKGARWSARQQRFGATAMEIYGPVPAPLGRPLSGTLRAAQPLSPTGEYRIRLTCYDIHETRNTARSIGTGPYRTYETEVWNEEISLPAGSDAMAGLPFRFEIPASVGPRPVPPLEGQQGRYFRFKATIALPGFRRIVIGNTPPVARRWQLTVEAPMTGAGYRADFAVPVHEG